MQRKVLELEGGQTWGRLLLLGQRGCHGNRRGVGHAGEGGGSRGDARRALPLPVGRPLGLKDVGGVLQEGPSVGEVLMLEDLKQKDREMGIIGHTEMDRLALCLTGGRKVLKFGQCY